MLSGSWKLIINHNCCWNQHPPNPKHHEPLDRADSSGDHWDERFIHCRRFSTTILLLVQSRTSLKRCRLVNLPDQILDCGKNPLLNLIVWDRRHRVPTGSLISQSNLTCRQEVVSGSNVRGSAKDLVHQHSDSLAGTCWDYIL